MPGVIDPFHMEVNELPAVWTPVQWEQSEEERIEETEAQARASLLWGVGAAEAMLRMLLDETGITRAYGPPPGYDAEIQGDWDDSLMAFEFEHPIKVREIKREADYLFIEYDFADFGHWMIEIETEKVTIERI